MLDALSDLPGVPVKKRPQNFVRPHDSIGLDILRLPIEAGRANAPGQTCEGKNIKQQTPWLEGVKYRVVQIDVSQKPNGQRER